MIIKRRKILTISSAIILSFSLLSGAAAAENTEFEESPFLSNGALETMDPEFLEQLEYSDAVVNKHKRYRQSNNLDYSEETIRAALNSPNATNTIPKYSIALTEEEEAYIQERDELMVKYGDEISKMMKENGVTITSGPNNEITESYSDIGTFYQEKSNGLKFVISFSVINEETNRIKKAIEDLVPAEYLEFREANFSEAELVSAYEGLIKESREAGIALEEVTVAVKENSVIVKVEDQKKVDLIEENILKKETSINSLKAYKPSIFKVVVGEANDKLEARTSTLNTMAGGLLIVNNSADSKTGTGPFCTLGTLATKGNDRFIITAGHCFDSWGSNVYQGGELIGTKHYQYVGDKADIGVIKVDAGKKISNYVYKYSWTDSRITSYQSSPSSLDVGDNICMSGARSGFLCGEVTSLNTSMNGGSGYIQTDIDSAGGDSGAPYWYNGVLMGIHSGGEISGTPFTRFTHIANAIAYGGVWTPYTSNTVK
ncbi:Trypsin [Paenibacillus sp. CF095]|uniref:S1 family peptidase n=1 Tax=Paenibacillus sp. CF095 TaxID=1881033 RepID=UPI000880BD71|nr:S1 family peptidase [Paenibacillus sp. CF095]SDD51652.1 Trypsin [Paenibacillus sp. CF095]